MLHTVHNQTQVPEHYGHHMFVWDWQKRTLTQTIDVGAEGAIPLEVCVAVGLLLSYSDACTSGQTLISSVCAEMQQPPSDLFEHVLVYQITTHSDMLVHRSASCMTLSSLMRSWVQRWVQASSTSHKMRPLGSGSTGVCVNDFLCVLCVQASTCDHMM